MSFPWVNQEIPRRGMQELPHKCHKQSFSLLSPPPPWADCTTEVPAGDSSESPNQVRLPPPVEHRHLLSLPIPLSPFSRGCLGVPSEYRKEGPISCRHCPGPTQKEGNPFLGLPRGTGVCSCPPPSPLCSLACFLPTFISP